MGKNYKWSIETDISVRILDAKLTNSIIVQKTFLSLVLDLLLF